MNALHILIGLLILSAIYLSEHANRKVRAAAKPLMEIVAGIPTVVYGFFFAAFTVAPFLPGIVGGILLAVSRAIGETMIVVMTAGLSANLTANPLKAVTTVTAQFVTLLVGDQEFDSPDARPSPRPFGKTELISKLVKTTTSEKAWG